MALRKKQCRQQGQGRDQGVAFAFAFAARRSPKLKAAAPKLIEEMFDRNNFLTEQDCMRLGLVDEVVPLVIGRK